MRRELRTARHIYQRPLPTWTAAHLPDGRFSTSPCARCAVGLLRVCYWTSVLQHCARKERHAGMFGIHRFPQEVKIMHIEPLGDRVVVKPKPKEERTKGGIFLPDTATKERPMQGKVIAVGSGRRSDEGRLIP